MGWDEGAAPRGALDARAHPARETTLPLSFSWAKQAPGTFILAPSPSPARCLSGRSHEAGEQSILRFAPKQDSAAAATGCRGNGTSTLSV